MNNYQNRVYNLPSLILAILLVLAFPFSALCSEKINSPRGEILKHVVLRQNVMVDNHLILLGDLFKGAGNKASIAVAYAPEPGQKGSMLDHTLVIWTNELGKGNTHTLDHIPFVLAGNGFGFRMGRSMSCENVPHNRFLLSLAHAVGHPLKTFGNPKLSAGGPLILG